MVTVHILKLDLEQIYGRQWTLYLSTNWGAALKIDDIRQIRQLQNLRATHVKSRVDKNNYWTMFLS